MTRPEARPPPEPAAAPVRPQVPFALPDITETEIEAVVNVLRSGWLTSGPQVAELEREFAAAVGARHAVAVSSGTAALHLSLEALGVGPGDVVYLSPYTFAATGEVIRHVGARAEFVDVDPVTANLDPALLAAAVERTVRSGDGRPAAVVPVHVAGVPCDLEEIWELARVHGLGVVEDAAHAFPARYRGNPVGRTPEDLDATACFSFYATKTITTGEGGMLTTASDRVADRVRMMSLHGLSRQAWSRYRGGPWRYDIEAAGFKYNLSDLAAALGGAQLARSEAMTCRRRDIAERYAAGLTGCPALELPSVPADRETSWHLYMPRLRPPRGEAERDLVMDRLRERGIGVSMHFIPLHVHSYWQRTCGVPPEGLPRALDVSRRAFSLPIYSAMSDDDVDRVVEEVETACRDL